jgi:hypothetical protein
MLSHDHTFITFTRNPEYVNTRAPVGTFATCRRVCDVVAIKERAATWRRLLHDFLTATLALIKNSISFERYSNAGVFMGRMNASYGSEFHLLRMLGRHRRFFDSRICEATGADSVEWLDFPSGDMRKDKNGNPIWD